jgi:hypothetical protein
LIIYRDALDPVLWCFMTASKLGVARRDQCHVRVLPPEYLFSYLSLEGTRRARIADYKNETESLNSLSFLVNKGQVVVLRIAV